MSSRQPEDVLNFVTQILRHQKADTSANFTEAIFKVKEEFDAGKILVSTPQVPDEDMEKPVDPGFQSDAFSSKLLPYAFLRKDRHSTLMEVQDLYRISWHEHIRMQ